MKGANRLEITPEYLAGFMDGEGSIMITKLSPRESSRAYYRARIDLANTDWRALEEIRDQYGGILVAGPRQRDTWKTAYHLVWTDGRVARLLARLRPYLRLKRKQADLVLEFINHVKDTVQTKEGRFFAPHPKRVVEFRDTLYRKMKGLNMRGRVPTVSLV